MRDKKSGLYYHGYDFSRQAFWCDKSTGLSRNFWLRAIGWFSVALADLLEILPDSKGKIIDGTRSDADENGVFTGKVEVSGVKKNGFSSFYPESWTPQQVVDAINTAYDDALSDKSNPHGSIWIGYCGDLEIDMYLNSDKKITTAFPVYEGD